MIVLRVKSTTAPTCRECSRRVKVHGSLCRNCWRESVRNEAPCMVEGCGEPHATQGYCSKHSKRVARYGDPHAVRLRSVELAAQLPEPDGDCINWPYITKTGYGRAVIRGKAYMAHRYVYEQQVGPISAGMELDHLCLNRACVNVNHLEPVTGAENKRRRWIRWWARQESV